MLSDQARESLVGVHLFRRNPQLVAFLRTQEAQAFPTLQYPLPTAAQLQLAFEAEIDLTYMGGIERGKRNRSLLVMARIASVPLTKLLAE
jgi:hypothetical protein